MMATLILSREFWYVARFLTCVEYRIGLEVLTAVVMTSSTVWEITPRNPLKVMRRVGGTCRLHLQGRRIRQARNSLCLPPAFMLSRVWHIFSSCLSVWVFILPYNLRRPLGTSFWLLLLIYILVLTCTWQMRVQPLLIKNLTRVIALSLISSFNLLLNVTDV
jgi:hypothetical protein